MFNKKFSLLDLARELERDILIYEYEPKRFKLVYKKDIAEIQKKAMTTKKIIEFDAELDRDRDSNKQDIIPSPLGQRENRLSLSQPKVLLPEELEVTDRKKKRKLRL